MDMKGSNLAGQYFWDKLRHKLGLMEAIINRGAYSLAFRLPAVLRKKGRHGPGLVYREDSWDWGLR